MNLTAITLTLAKAKGVLDGIFAVSSLIIVPCMITMPLVWLLEQPPKLRVMHRDRPTVVSAVKVGQEPGDKAVSFPGFELAEKPLRTVYHLEIVDQQGKTVYTYPQVETRDEPTFDNMLLPIPKTVGEGVYQLVARVTCTINPLTSVDATVVVASLTVD